MLDIDVTPPATPCADTDAAPVPPGPSGPSGRSRGSVRLDVRVLRAIRWARLLSQQDLADEFDRNAVRVSIRTLKRAEAGQAVRYRIAREIARHFNLPLAKLVLADGEPSSG